MDQDSSSKKKYISNVVKVTLSLSFFFGVIYYLFLQNPERISEDLLDIDTDKYKFIIFSIIFGGWAYVSRGIRWIILIEALGYKTSRINSISAVSVGYFANLILPRAGEIIRCTSLSKSDNIPVDKLFGTILIERVIDFIFLIFLIGLTIILKFKAFSDAFSQAIQHSDTSNLKLILTITFAVILIIIFFWDYIKSTSIYVRIRKFFQGIKEGFVSIKQIQNKTKFWIHTILIWVMYFLMTYVCFFILSETSHLGFGDGLFILVIGGIGMVVPAPGGVGSYHFFVMVALVALSIPQSMFSLDPYDTYNSAMLFPFIVHTAQTILAIILGMFGSLILYKSAKRKKI